MHQNHPRVVLNLLKSDDFMLGFLCITFFIYTPKSSKSYFVLNILKSDDFMFLTKTLCQMLSNFI